jgi:HSF-type DNA-binding
MKSIRRNARTAPFLIKLQTICASIPADLGYWSENGLYFNVPNPDGFFEYLKSFFEGSTRTFFRQLSYFRFVKGELLPKGFTFMHPNFVKDDIQRLALIRRVSCASSNSSLDSDSAEDQPETPAVSSEKERCANLEKSILTLQGQVADLTKTVAALMYDLKRSSGQDCHDAPLRKRFISAEGETLFFGDFEDGFRVLPSDSMTMHCSFS